MTARPDSPSRVRTALATMVATVVAACPLAGCAVPTAVPPPPGGGTRLVLSYARYASDVEPILIAKGCDVAGDCHGGGIRGTYALSPSTAVDTAYDFSQTVLQVSSATAESSDILLRPLAMAAGGRPHSVKVFADTTDPGYQKIIAWIRAGVRQ